MELDAPELGQSNIDLKKAVHDDPSLKTNSFIILLPLVLSLFLLVSTLLRRSRREKTVSCWFCHHTFRVPHGNENCFDCPKCEQYNGFKEDGDYNKPIPSQYNEDLNYPVTGGPAPGCPAKPSWENGLCAQCNHNQAVKIKLLAAFQPVLESTEDEELSAYTIHLEKLYRLCWQCQLRVETVLAQQDMQLAPLLPNYTAAKVDAKTEQTKLSRSTVIIYVSIVGRLLALFMSLLYLCCVPSLKLPSSGNLKWDMLQYLQRMPTALNMQTDRFICVLGLATTFTSTLLEKMQKSGFALPSLWTLLLLWTYKTDSLGLYDIPCSLFPGDKIIASLALATLSIASLLKSFKIKKEQSRIKSCSLNKMISKKEATDSTAKETSPIEDWISKVNNKTPSVSSRFTPSLPETISQRGPKLSQVFGQMKITGSKAKTLSLADHALGYEFAFRKCYQRNQSSKNTLQTQRPIIRPSQFLRHSPSWTTQSLSQSSWVAGGLWSLPSECPAQASSTHFAFSGGMLTPPPSIDGSQNSQPGSIFSEALNNSGQSVYKTSGRYWPPSHSVSRQNVAPVNAVNPETSPSTGKAWKYCSLPNFSNLKTVFVMFSISINVILLTYCAVSKVTFR